MLPRAREERRGNRGKRSYLAAEIRGGQAGTGLSAGAPLHADRLGPARREAGEIAARRALQLEQVFTPGF